MVNNQWTHALAAEPGRSFYGFRVIHTRVHRPSGPSRGYQGPGEGIPAKGPNRPRTFFCSRGSTGKFIHTCMIIFMRGCMRILVTRTTAHAGGPGGLFGSGAAWDSAQSSRLVACGAAFQQKAAGLVGQDGTGPPGADTEQGRELGSVPCRDLESNLAR